MKNNNLKDSLEKFFTHYKKQISIRELMKKLDISHQYIDLVIDNLYYLEKEGKIFYDKNFTYMHVPSEFYYKFGELKKSNTNQYYINLKNGAKAIIKDIGTAKLGDSVFVTIEKGNHPKCFEGKIERVVKKAKTKNNNSYIVKGTLKRDGNNFYIKVDDNKIYIPNENLHTAFIGDIINVRINNKIGNVIEILERHHTNHVFRCISKEGKLEWSSISIPSITFPVTQKKYKEGDIIVASIEENTLKIVDKLKNNHSISDDINALIIEHGFANTFSNAVIEEAKCFAKEKVTTGNGRVDLRSLETFTIDPKGAKDLDDAVSLVYKDNIYHLYAHIANPTQFIKMNSLTFQEAFRRCFSVYPPDDVIPMLHEIISKGICSLNEDGDKYAITCRLDINENGDIIGFDLFKSIIHSNKKMNYEDVNKFFEGENDEYLPFKDTLFKMRDLTNILEKKKSARGTINIDTNSNTYILDEYKNPIAIFEEKRGIAELIIENFMLIVNEEIAKFARNLGLPYIYRNHEKPTVQKENNLKNNLMQKGYFVQKIGNIEKPEILQRFLNRLLKGKTKEEKKIICEMVLKTMTRAYYDYINNGHYGLALECYGTFTSPARKFSDLINHMIIDEFLETKDTNSANIEKYREFIKANCEYISEKQKDADLLDQEIGQLILNKYADNFINIEVKGKILFVNRYGIYVKDENGQTGVILYRKGITVNGSSIMVNGREYHINEQIPIVLKSRNDNELFFDFGTLKEKKLVRKKEKREKNKNE